MQQQNSRDYRKCGPRQRYSRRGWRPGRRPCWRPGAQVEKFFSEAKPALLPAKRRDYSFSAAPLNLPLS